MNISYIRFGDYFVPDLKLPGEARPIGKWGRMYREYLKEHHPIQFNNLVLSGNLWTYLADLNEQVQKRIDTLIIQLSAAEEITEELKAADPMAWVQNMNNIQIRAEEIVLQELIYGGNCMSILEKLWYGNIEPAVYDISPSKEYKELLQLISRNEDKLLATMTDAQKELFTKYADCVREYQVMAECLLFQNSFRLGARIMMEILKGDL